MRQEGEGRVEGLAADVVPLHERVVDVERVGPEDPDHPKDLGLGVIEAAGFPQKVDDVHLVQSLG